MNTRNQTAMQRLADAESSRQALADERLEGAAAGIAPEYPELDAVGDAVRHARELIVRDDMSPADRAAAANRAAAHIELLHTQRRVLAGLVLAGKAPVDRVNAAGKLISECISDLRWFAERLDKKIWGAASPDVTVNVALIGQRLREGRDRVIASVARPVSIAQRKTPVALSTPIAADDPAS